MSCLTYHVSVTYIHVVYRDSSLTIKVIITNMTSLLDPRLSPARHRMRSEKEENMDNVKDDARG